MQTKKLAYQTKMIRKILKSTEKVNLPLVLSFLDQKTIEIIYKITKQLKSQKFISSLCAIQYLMSHYLNRVDRSYFFLFYGETQVIRIQKQNIKKLAIEKSQSFLPFPCYFDELKARIKVQIMQCQMSQQISKGMYQLIFDSDIPMPKIKKQTVAIYCESSFQLFLSEIQLGAMSRNYLQPWQESLKEFLTYNEQQYLRILIKSSQKLSDLYQENKHKILTVRYYPSSITTSNWNSYIIDNFHIHNIIVILNSVIDNLISACYQIIIQHKDPLMKFVEFVLRYSMLKNTIITIEQHLWFIFQKYHQLFQECFPQFKVQPIYNIWHPTLSKWNQKMCHIYGSLNFVYSYIATIERNKNLLKFLNQQCTRIPLVFNQDNIQISSIKNNLVQDQFLLKLRQRIYQDEQSIFETFLNNNEENYSIIAKDYLQFLIDCSVNQYSVHWSGSSNQKLSSKSPYYNFQKYFIEYNRNYIEYLNSIVFENIETQSKFQIFKFIVETDLQFIHSLVKPLTLKTIVEDIYKVIQLKKITTNDSTQKQGFTKFNFTYGDNLLKYFNQKNKIPETCPQKLTPFYNVFVAVQFQQLIKTAQHGLVPNQPILNILSSNQY